MNKNHAAIYARIIALALRLEPNLTSVMAWLHTIPISRLEDQTAIQLVCRGQGDRVIEFLGSALKEDAQYRVSSSE